jgi:hypothetical protein
MLAPESWQPESQSAVSPWSGRPEGLGVEAQLHRLSDQPTTVSGLNWYSSGHLNRGLFREKLAWRTGATTLCRRQLYPASQGLWIWLQDSVLSMYRNYLIKKVLLPDLHEAGVAIRCRFLLHAKKRVFMLERWILVTCIQYISFKKTS